MSPSCFPRPNPLPFLTGNVHGCNVQNRSVSCLQVTRPPFPTVSQQTDAPAVHGAKKVDEISERTIFVDSMLPNPGITLV
jgi:hypothetical protein